MTKCEALGGLAKNVEKSSTVCNLSPLNPGVGALPRMEGLFERSSSLRVERGREMDVEHILPSRLALALMLHAMCAIGGWSRGSSKTKGTCRSALPG